MTIAKIFEYLEFLMMDSFSDRFGKMSVGPDCSKGGGGVSVSTADPLLIVAFTSVDSAWGNGMSFVTLGSKLTEPRTCEVGTVVVA